MKFPFFRFLQKQKCCHFPIISDWNYDLRHFVLLGQRKTKRFSFFFGQGKPNHFRLIHTKKTKRFLFYLGKENLILFGQRKPNHSRFIGQRKPNCVFVLFGQGKPNHSRLWRKKSKPRTHVCIPWGRHNNVPAARAALQTALPV